MRILPVRSIPALVLAALAACSGGGGGGGGGTTPQFGSVSGTVTRGGTPLAGVTVSVSGGGSATTSAAGLYTIASVATGTRTVTVTLPDGHIAAAHNGHTAQVQVGAGQTAAASFQLVRGAVVTAAGTSFTPAAVSVPTGGVVRWVNGGGTHTVTPSAAQPGGFAAAPLGAGATFQHTFGTAGAFDYFCQPHQAMGMTGSVTVTP